jgi:hypothetical protein
MRRKRQSLTISSASPAPAGLLQRACACGQHTQDGEECESCRKQRLSRQHAGAEPVSEVPAIVRETLAAPGQPLHPMTRAELEPRFGHDFSHVRVHADGRAAESARAVSALAYTVAPHIVFGAGQYRPGTAQGQRLLAHELAHVVQQRPGPPSEPGHLEVDAPDSTGEREAQRAASAVTSGWRPSVGLSSLEAPQLTSVLQRACTPAAVCSAPIAGSAGGFGISEAQRERAARARRGRMSPVRQRATGHTGHARQLEIFLEGQSPGLVSNIHGIFIDMDLSPGTGALTMPCDQMVPPITGATKPCVFVHGKLNQEALAFNRTSDPSIDGIPREEWRIQTLQMLTHEVQHVLFDTAGLATPAGITTPTCTRSNISHELSELNAIISEFPVAFRAIPSGAAAADPSRTRLDDWFRTAIMGGGEDIRGILSSIGCQCECSEVDAFVIDTFNFVASSWSVAERTAFNAELRRPVWGIRWPL